MVPCTTNPHPTIYNSYYITGEYGHGSIQLLPASSFTAYLRKQCERENGCINTSRLVIISRRLSFHRNMAIYGQYVMGLLMMVMEALHGESMVMDLSSVELM